MSGNNKIVNSHSGAKREPVAHAINPKAVSEIGNAQFKSSEQMSAGRGFQAPSPAGKTVHPSGSQKRHT